MSHENNQIVKLLWPHIEGGTQGVYELIHQNDERVSLDRVRRYMLAVDNPKYVKMQNGHFGALKRSIIADATISASIKYIFNSPDFTKKNAVDELKKLNEAI